MTHNPSRLPLDQDDFDLSNIFIGREQQMDLFEFYLQRWKNSLTKLTATDHDSLLLTAPSPHQKIPGLVMLLYGRGSFGKSTLLRRYRDMVLQENEISMSSKILASKIVDWEALPDSRRSPFSLTADKEIDAPGYFTMLSTHLAGVLG